MIFDELRGNAEGKSATDGLQHPVGDRNQRSLIVDLHLQLIRFREFFALPFDPVKP
jgi:hypothetical protein